MTNDPLQDAAKDRPNGFRTRFAIGLLALLVWLGVALPSTGRVPVSGGVSGVVLDPSGAPVPRARVILLTANDTEICSTLTDDGGLFRLERLDPATYVLAVQKAGFGEHRRSVVIRDAAGVTLDITLGIGPVSESVTVTALRGIAQDVQTSPQMVTVTGTEEMSRREMAVFTRALIGEPGVYVQQTSTSQGSPFIRGLTGQQVVVLVDGVRFNNATFRPGANQYTALLDPAFVDRVEIVRGPNGAQYGSDSLGGTINVLTSPLGGGRGGVGVDGGFALTLESADRSVAGSFRLAGGSLKWGVLMDATARRAQDLRTGGGIDSHSVATRLLGLPSAVLGDRLQDTAFTRYGIRSKLSIRPGANDAVTLQYIRGEQLGARRYDQLNGGLGNLVNRFDPQTLDLVTVRYNRIRLPWFDTLSAAGSFNGQRDDRTYQSVNNAKLGLRSPVSVEHNRTNAFGYQAQATRRLGAAHSLAVGGEIYDEYVTSLRTDFGYSQATGGFTDGTAVRARFPNGARYRTVGLYGQDCFPLFSDRLSATLAARYSRFSYRQSGKNNAIGSGGPLVPDYRTSFGDLTFNTGLAFSLSHDIVLTATVSRGFRAPNVNDLGSIGVSGMGFEVSPDEGVRLGASVAPLPGGQPTTLSQARPVRALEPERLLNYEAGVRLNRLHVNGSLADFDSEIASLIERQMIILPAGSVGQVIAGQSIIRQDPAGAVYTSLSNSPVFVRTNAGRVRLRGAEASLMVRLGSAFALTGNVSSITGVDPATGLPPGLENGLPPTHGMIGLRWEPPGRRYWVEGYSYFADAQRRLSGNDLEQARIGGIRTQQEVTNFFNNGAVARDLVQGGILLATGETLAQVLTRVLGPDLTARVPFVTRNPGYVTLNIRGGVRFSRRANLTLLVENLLDRNYRTMGSGVDAPGVNLLVRQAFEF
ncbi:MAG: TonB-dependent receptor [Acidobacteria bacterium]|nr:TonB-dependent receptor [Acidobacteriota bacterium]